MNPRLKSVALIWGLVILALHLLNRFALPWGLSSLLVAMILLYVPMWKSPETSLLIKLQSGALGRALFWFWMISLLIFPVYFLVSHFAIQILWGGHPVNFPKDIWLAQAPGFFLHQLLLVALPEEMFFRGYLLGELKKIWPTQNRVFGVPFGKAALITSVIFAFSHSLVTFQWWHFSIFFPALVFTWLREKTGRIWACSLFHAASNLASWTLFVHYS